jgi:hypothetical protein
VVAFYATGAAVGTLSTEPGENPVTEKGAWTGSSRVALEKVFDERLIAIVVPAIGTEEDPGDGGLGQADRVAGFNLTLEYVLLANITTSTKFEENLECLADVPAGEASDDSATVLFVIKEAANHGMEEALKLFNGELDGYATGDVEKAARTEAAGFGNDEAESFFEDIVERRGFDAIN